MQVNDEDALAAFSAPTAQFRNHASALCAPKQDKSPARPENCSAASCLSALYWVHKAVAPAAKSSKWFRDTAWAAELAPRPATNALNPIPAKPLQLAYSHPTDPEWVGVPRFWGLSTFGAPREDRRSLGDALSDAATRLAMPLRAIQTQALEAALKSARACGGAFVQADCGTL